MKAWCWLEIFKYEDRVKLSEEWISQILKDSPQKAIKTLSVPLPPAPTVDIKILVERGFVPGIRHPQGLDAMSGQDGGDSEEAWLPILVEFCAGSNLDVEKSEHVL